MSTIRIVKTIKNPFVAVPKNVLENRELSFKAKGIMSYLLGRPPGWEIRCHDLAKQSTDKITAVYSALKELRAVGYVRLLVIRKDGKIFRKVYEVSDTSSKKLNLGFLSEGNLNEGFLNEGNLSYNKNRKESKNRIPAASRRRVAAASMNLENEKFKFSQIIDTYAQFSVKNRFHVGKKGASLTGWKNRTLHNWSMACAGLVERLEGNVTRVEKVLKWFISHHTDEWLPTCHTFISFSEKFDSIEKAMKRNTKPRRNNRQWNDEEPDAFLSEEDKLTRQYNRAMAEADE